MEDTVSQPTDKATAAREMLATLRLLAISGHLQNGRTQIERWESALSDGEPGLGRLAAIKALLEGLNFDLGELVLRLALEKVQQIALGSRTESGTEPGGSAYLTPGDVAVVLDALDLAADYKRERADECPDCDFDPQSALCPACEGRLARADDFDAVYALLGGAK